MPAQEDEALPPYAFVPRGPWPHPTASPLGHSADRPRAAVGAISGDDWAGSRAYRRGITLFNAGYYWEAHEAWEGLWHAHGRQGPVSEVLRGLIKLAAAGVKVRQQQRHGIVTHARRAQAHFEAARKKGGRRQLGLDLAEAGTVALRIAASPPADPGQPDDRVALVFDFLIEPRSHGDDRATFPRRGDREPA